jgi:hypothetical protein
MHSCCISSSVMLFSFSTTLKLMAMVRLMLSAFIGSRHSFATATEFPSRVATRMMLVMYVVIVLCEQGGREGVAWWCVHYVDGKEGKRGGGMEQRVRYSPQKRRSRLT